MLSARDRIRFHPSVEAWITTSLALPGLRLGQMTPEVASLSHRLPGTLHADPADRLIVATAIELNATLATRDKALLAYGTEGHAKVLAA